MGQWDPNSYGAAPHTPISPHRGNLWGNGTSMLMGPPHNPIYGPIRVTYGSVGPHNPIDPYMGVTYGSVGPQCLWGRPITP